VTQYLPSLILALIAAGAVWFFVDVFMKAGTSYRDRFKERASRNLSSMFLFIEAEKLFVMNIIMVVAVFIVTWAVFGNIYVSLVFAAAAAASPPLIFRFLRNRRIERAVQALPDTLMSVASGMRSGQSLQQSMETVVSFEKGPTAQELGLFLRELRVGVGFNEALDNLYARLPRVEIQLVVAAMKIARETGSNLAETLERIASTLRSRLQMEGKIRSLTAQGRLQGLVMAGLPIFMALMLFKMQPKEMGYLFTTLYGWVVVIGILTLDAIGYFFVRKIVDIDV
jgi:tight adherence protein B